MEKGRRILFTNNTLAEPAGTELSLHDAALSLKARGHEVAAFSQQHGTIAQRLAAAGMPVLENLEDAPWTPDLIHGHHEWETTIAALRWPQAPVVSFCRGPYLWQEAPCRAPNVVLYGAVDEECRRRLVEKEGIPAEIVELVLNGVDLEKFAPRPPVPQKAGCALIFSNYASEDNFVPVVRAACESQGITLTVVGRGAGNASSSPQDLLGSFDIVFAKGKAALEALATGCAVVVADTAGLGPFVTRANFSPLRRLSFGNPAMTDSYTVEGVRARLLEFDAQEAALVSKLVRETCGLQHTVDMIETVHARAVAEYSPAAPERWAKFAATFLAAHTSSYKLGRRVHEAWNEAWPGAASNPLDPATADRILTHFLQNETKRARLQERCDRLRRELDSLKAKDSRSKVRKGLLGRLIRSDDPKE